MSNSSLIEKGKCPFCKKVVYTPTQATTPPFAFHIAVGMHMAKCPDNPDYEESDMDKFIRDLLGLDQN